MRDVFPNGSDGRVDGPIQVSCPDCSGVLEIRVDGPRHHVVFVCRVGHTFSIIDLLSGKEDELEAYLWSVLNTLGELIDVLRTLTRQAERQGLQIAPQILRQRMANAQRQHADMRRIIEDNRAIEVGEDIARIHAGGTR